MPSEKDQASGGLAGQIGEGRLYQRSRYFTGKYLAARDFEDEQAYMIGRRRLHNRLFHGWGIIDGLEVRCHHDPNCATRWVEVQPGAALDCRGRELVLTEKQEYELPLPQVHSQQGVVPAPIPSPFLLCLSYRETETEFVPALYAESAYSKTVQANRIAESAQLTLIRLTPQSALYWPAAPGRDGMPKDVVAAAQAQDYGCPPGDVVPLALIGYDADKPEQGFDIWTTGRRRVFAPARLLTHIVHVNWPHGGTVTLAHLRDELGGKLTVTFDRRLRRPAPGQFTGINRDTFVVQRGGSEGELHMLRHERRVEPTMEADDDYTAVFTIDPDLLKEDHQNLADSLIRVTLRCDFILDAYGRPVDGNHLGGQLPSGDGVAGGTFESWFRVAPASEDERKRRRQEGIKGQIRERERRRAAIEQEAKERIDEREEEIRRLQEGLEEEQGEKQDARRARHELHERVDRLEAEIKEIREDSRRRIGEREEEIEELRRRLGHERYARGEEREEREELARRIAELEANRNEIREDAEREIARRRREIQELREAEAAAGGEAAEEDEEIQNIRARIAALEAEIRTLGEERDREVERLNEEIEQLQAELEPEKKGGKG